MSKWLSESKLLARYTSSGALNTLLGFATIFTLMACGVSPYIANLSGYVVGFILGFIVSRSFVFRSNGHLAHESMRYVVAFVLCVVLNLLCLKVALTQVNPLMAQLISAMVYSSSMYAATRWFVFCNNDLNQ